MWLADDVGTPHRLQTWVPDDRLADFQARRVSEGTLDLLDWHFNRRGREEHESLGAKIEALVAEKKTIRGRGASERKAAVDQQIEKLRDDRKSTDPRPPIRPKLGLWSGYHRRGPEPTPVLVHTEFDNEILILRQIDGPRLPSVSTLAVTQALRGAVIKHSGIQPPPSWVSGHLEDGQPLRDGNQHLACIPLPFVSSDYADGHLLGAALVFPRWVPRQERGRVLGPIVLDPSLSQPKSIELKLGALGVWTLVKRDWSESRHALKPETWTAHPRGYSIWATVTPAVLDGFPKEDRLRDREAWEIEVAGMISRACQRVGLSEPISIEFGTTSWHRGSPRASAKRRPVRGRQGEESDTTAIGDGFPTYPAKGTNGLRPQLHLYLRFAEPVVGPMLVGAGRFLGYGLCKPLWEGAGR